MNLSDSISLVNDPGERKRNPAAAIEAARNRIKDVSGNTLKPLRFNVPEAHDLAAPRYLWAKKAHPKARYNIREPMRRMVPVTFG